MKKYFIAAIISAVSIAGYAQNLFSETRTVEPFSEISACCGIEVVINEGELGELKVEVSDPSVISHIETAVVNGVLDINVTNLQKSRSKNLTIKVTLSATQLSGIKCSSGASITSTGKITGNDMQISAGSGSRVNLNIIANLIECNSSSGGAVKLSGKTINMEAHASSSGTIEANELSTEKAYATASAGGRVVLKVNEELSAKASSGGSVVYTGDATISSQKQSSGGSVRKG